MLSIDALQWQNCVFCRNGPTGSAICVFTFGEQENDISRVFNGDYLQLDSDQWVTVNNYQPFTVSRTSCTVVYVHNMSSKSGFKRNFDSSNVLHEVFKNTN